LPTGAPDILTDYEVRFLAWGIRFLGGFLVVRFAGGIFTAWRLARPSGIKTRKSPISEI